MKLLEERIRTHGKIREGGVLKVDSFLNHQMDVKLFQEMGKEFLRLFGDCGVTKILTIEASGIGIACVTAQFFDCPVIFAKKNKTRNIAGDVYTSKVESFTHGKVYDIIVSKEFLYPEDRVLFSQRLGPAGPHQPGAGCRRHPGGCGHLCGEGIPARRRFDPRYGSPGGVPGPHQSHERGGRRGVLLSPQLQPPHPVGAALVAARREGGGKKAKRKAEAGASAG